MSNVNLKPINSLRARCDLSQFSNISLLSSMNFFSNLWEAVFKLLTLNNSYETLQDIFISTLSFFPPTQTQSIEKVHSKFIKDFSSVLSANNPVEINKLCESPDMTKLLTRIQELLPLNINSAFSDILGLLAFTKLSIIEKSEGAKDVSWGDNDPILTVSVLRIKEQFYFLYPKEKIVQKKTEEINERPDSPLLPCGDKEETLKLDELDDETLLEHPDSDHEQTWEETQALLNKNNLPIIKNLLDNPPATLTLQDLSIPPKDLQRFSSAIPINSLNFFSDLTLSIINLFISQNICHIPLQIFTNSLYYFPFTHSKEYERKHLKFTQELIEAFAEEKLERLKSLLKSEEIKKILDDVGNCIKKDESSVIGPLFPLIKTWKLKIVEKSDRNEYFWNTRKPLATVFLWIKDGVVYLLVPKDKLVVKELRVKNENLEKIEDSDTLEACLDQDILGMENEDVLEVEDYEDVTIDTINDKSSIVKNVKFKPDLTIDIEKDRRELSPSPTMPRSALKKDGRLSPLYQNRQSIINESPVLKYVQSTKKYNNPVERYIALSKSKNQTAPDS